jgi:hypothetical protein
MRATVAGMVINRISLREKDMVFFSSSKCPPATCSEKLGSVAVPMAMAKTRQNRADEDIDLINRGAEGCGQHEGSDPPYARMFEVEIWLQPDPHLHEERPLHGQLKDSPDHDPHGESHDRFPKKITNRKRRRNHGYIQNNGGQGRRGKMPQGIQNAHAQGYKGNEENIGKHQTGEKNREIILSGNLDEAGRHDGDNDGREENPCQRNDDQDYGKSRKGDIGQFQCVFFRGFFQVVGKYRNEGHRQRPLGKKPS